MYTIVRSDRCNTNPPSFKYAVKEVRDDGELAMVTLDDVQGRNDPLDAVRNVELRISADGRRITAINLDGDCVCRKEAAILPT